MIGKILKTIFKSGKKSTETIGKSMEFIDTLLEKEYISNSVKTVKNASGKVVESAGTAYQQTADFIEDNIDTDKIKSSVDKLIEKGKDVTEDLSESMQAKSETFKNIYKEGEKIVQGFTDEEE